MKARRYPHSRNAIPYWFLGITLLFYLWVAYVSSGFHHPDEHYQIIEFANYKLGLIKRSDLAWEFNAQIRPGLQPAIGYLIFKAAGWFGVSNGYVLAFLLRAVTAIFSVWVIRKFVCATMGEIKPVLRWVYILLSFFLWFLPYINVRFSSETWSGLFFLLALALIFSSREVDKKRSMLIGLVFGIAILFRYQSALLFLGTLLWFLIVKKIRLSKMILMVGGCFFVLVIGVVVDYWLYGQFTITLYNYFYVNIIQEVASHYGTAPWYKIFEYIINSPGPIGLFILFAFFFVLIRKPLDLIIWAVIPFLAVHIIIPHKELRFLFPIAVLVPLFLILAWQEFIMAFKAKRPELKWMLIALPVLLIFLFTNMAGLIVVASKGAGNTNVAVTEYIHKHYVSKKLNVLYIKRRSPYYDWAHPKNTFYSSKGIHLTPIVTVWQDNLTAKLKNGFTNLLILPNNAITGSRTLTLLKKLHFVRMYQSIPPIDQKIISFYDASSNKNNLIVYEYQK